MQSYAVLAAYGACALLLGLSAFQVLLAAGLPLGHLTWGGPHFVLPRRLQIGSAVAVLIYATIALVVLDVTGLSPGLPGRVSEILIRVTAGYFHLA